MSFRTDIRPTLDVEYLFSWLLIGGPIMISLRTRNEALEVASNYFVINFRNTRCHYLKMCSNSLSNNRRAPMCTYEEKKLPPCWWPKQKKIC